MSDFSLGTIAVFLGFAAMFVAQTKDAFVRFVDPASVPVPTFVLSTDKPIVRPSLVLCLNMQTA